MKLTAVEETVPVEGPLPAKGDSKATLPGIAAPFSVMFVSLSTPDAEAVTL